MDVIKSILVDENGGVDLKDLIIFLLMTHSWTLAYEDGRILSKRMEIRVPLS